MNSKVVFRIVFLLIVFGFVAYANYPTFEKFFLYDQTDIQERHQKKHAQAEKLILELKNLDLFLPEIDANRIRIFQPEGNTFPMDNPVLQEILQDHFRYVQEEDANFLELKNPQDKTLFLSDFSKKLNQLAENAKRIESVALDEDQSKIWFYMAENKRLSQTSPPINYLLPEGEYEWLYDDISSSYQTYIADPPNMLNLGLDLKGGIYLDVGIDSENIARDFLNRRRESLERELQSKSLAAQVVIEENSIFVRSSQPLQIDWQEQEWNLLTEGLDIDETSSNEAKFTLQSEYRTQLESNALQQAMDIIRNRIDQLGVKEPIVQRRGDYSIVVQVPGQSDALRIKNLITEPANLEFRIVLPQNQADLGISLDFEDIDPVTKELRSTSSVPVSKVDIMRGDVVTDARVVFDQFTGAPQISMSLNNQGAQEFGQLTEKHVGESLAIVLDEKIRSTPRINQAIYGGQVSITGQFSIEEARDLAITLRSGSLPVSLTINEERFIGATLGESSVQQSVLSLIIGFAILGLFIAVYYSLAGVFAIVALITNVSLILGILSFFGATLTLPGIAGIILTVGMAIDASVLIFERIREELFAGSAPRKAIQQGFSRVAVTILDANITTLMIAVVLFQYGTGPVKGFALTLGLGILTTLFTSLVLSRTFFELKYLFKTKLEKILI